MKILLYLSACVLAILAQSEFSDEAQANILAAHNTARRQLAQGKFVANGIKKAAAANMRALKWDDDLAEQAQDYANSCPDDIIEMYGIGQNADWLWNTDDDDTDGYGVTAVADWISQVEEGWSGTKYSESAGIRYASQVLWASSSAVGCGIGSCGADQDRFDQADKYVVICNYKEAGNYAGKDIYKSGTACSLCPSGTKCSNSLCV